MAVGHLLAPEQQWSTEHVDRVRATIGDEACRRLGIFALPDGFLLSVVVPVYNEAATIDDVVERLHATGLPLEIVIVDDGSTDGTSDRLASLGEHEDVQVIAFGSNRGKGAALRSGFTAASGEVVVVQDADREYSPEDFRYLLQPILAGEADVAYGTRYGHHDRRVSPFWHQTVNRCITLLASIAIGLRLSDVETCYKMMRRERLLEVLPDLRENRFGIEIEITARLAAAGASFTERPIRYEHRWYDQGKKIGWKDGVAALGCIVKYSRPALALRR
ncbi:MAG: glycosyltransferase family 2 protein [Actinomycetota bacterium]